MDDVPELTQSSVEPDEEHVHAFEVPDAMHLHGHHFRRLGRSGETGPLRDALLLNANETAEVAFVADNPGKWLLHCHMLEHSAGGMMTWIDVAA